MNALRQEIRFARAPDGARLAFATLEGTGYPLVRAPFWFSHIERDGQCALTRPWLDALGTRYRFVRYDPRGCGLSDHRLDDCSLDAMVADLEAVADAARLERFALLGGCQGGPIALRYAARHPDRVSHLVLIGAYARGPLRRDPSLGQREAVHAQLKLV